MENHLQEIEIHSLNDLKDVIQNLKYKNSHSISPEIIASLNVQLHIINLINSATLVDSSFDLIFADFKKAIKNSNGAIKTEQIREKLHVFISNYIFFLDVKLRHSFVKDQEDTEALLEEAAHLLADNSADLLLLASGAGAPKYIVSKVALEILKKSKDKPGLLKKVFKWYNKEERQKKEVANFQHTLHFIFDKLERHKQSIGKSDITAGLISRWIPDVLTYRKSNRTFFTFLGVIASFFSTTILAMFLLFYFNNASLSDVLTYDNVTKSSYLITFLSATLVLGAIFSSIHNNIVIEKKLRKLEVYFYE